MNWKKILKIVGIMAISGAILGGAAIYYIFNMPQRNIEKEKPSYTMTAKQLYQEFAMNEDSSNVKYGNKVIQITGEIVELSVKDNEVNLVLEDPIEGISCALDSMAVVQSKDIIKTLKEHTKICLKGRCDGFDIIMGVVLTRCYFIN